MEQNITLNNGVFMPPIGCAAGAALAGGSVPSGMAEK